MLELYQYELSDIWPQDIDAEGRYGYDLSRHREGLRFHAYVVLQDDAYAGFALVAPAGVTRSAGCWMEQFFVLKRYRHSGVGAALARFVFSAHPGPWEAGEMFDNLPAQAFWQRVTQGWWKGIVQQLEVASAAAYGG